jgi:hypothetical protein
MPGSSMARFSVYDDANLMRKHIEDGLHRAVIGGMWEELGDLQLHFLKSRGLMPHHRLIDIGAGSFRAGVKLIPYLDAGNYYAIDAQHTLLEAGYAREIENLGLAARFSRANFAANASFDVLEFGQVFDCGIAQSVFTHMPIARLGDCLVALAPYFRDKGSLFATVFLVDENQAHGSVRHAPGGVVTAPNHDPFHTTEVALRDVALRSPDWHMEIIGNWYHPRDQQMISFVRNG